MQKSYKSFWRLFSDQLSSTVIQSFQDWGKKYRWQGLLCLKTFRGLVHHQFYLNSSTWPAKCSTNRATILFYFPLVYPHSTCRAVPSVFHSSATCLFRCCSFPKNALPFSLLLQTTSSLQIPPSTSSRKAIFSIKSTQLFTQFNTWKYMYQGISW